MSRASKIEGELLKLETTANRQSWRRGRFRYDRIGTPSMPRPKERTEIELLESYLGRWQDARAARVDKCLADILGHAREHDVRDFYAGIDRTTSPTSLQHVTTAPFSIATFKEAMVRVLAYEPPPPVKPWITRSRAAELEAQGIRRTLIELVFEVY